MDTTQVIHQTETGNVGLTVADIYHILEGNGAATLWNEPVDSRSVVQTVRSLVDAEEVLRLSGEVYGKGGPDGYALDVIKKSGSVNFAESVGDRCSFFR